MKHRTLIACVLLLSFVGGCATTPAAKTYQFRETYVATLTAIDQLAVAGKLSKDQAVQIQQLRPIGDAAEKAVVALQANGGSAYDAAFNAAQAVLNQLIAVQVAAKGK